MDEILKSIAYLKSAKEYAKSEPNELKSDTETITNLFNTAIEALEKQIGFHVSNISKDKGAWKDGYCKCGHYVTDSNNYCHDCGQKLDWADKE